MSYLRLPHLIGFVTCLAVAAGALRWWSTLPREVPTAGHRHLRSTNAVGHASETIPHGFIEEPGHAAIQESRVPGTRDRHSTTGTPATVIDMVSRARQTQSADPLTKDSAPLFSESSASIADMPSSVRSTIPPDPTIGHEAGRDANRVPPAIQLAESVRLPAALIPQENAPNKQSTVAKATEEIASTYYHDLQTEIAGALEPQNSGDTVTIPQIPETEQIRLRSDEQFRALYGNERYNQQVIGSALEVMLPPLPATP